MFRIILVLPCIVNFRSHVGQPSVLGSSIPPDPRLLIAIVRVSVSPSSLQPLIFLSLTYFFSPLGVSYAAPRNRTQPFFFQEPARSSHHNGGVYHSLLPLFRSFTEVPQRELLCFQLFAASSNEKISSTLVESKASALFSKNMGLYLASTFPGNKTSPVLAATVLPTAMFRRYRLEPFRELPRGKRRRTP